MRASTSAADLDVIDWLLQKDFPSVRYMTMRDLLDVAPGNEEMEIARRAIMESSPVAKIMRAQEPEGHWGQPQDFYQRSKYKGTAWNLQLLAQLEADGTDPGVQRAIDSVLQWSQCGHGGFTYKGSPEGGKKPLLNCLTANMAFSMIHFGRLEDGRVAKAVDLMAARFKGAGVHIYPKCIDCRSGVVKCLRALAEIPAAQRSTEVNAAIESYSEEILERCLDPHGTGDRHMRPEWLVPSAPLMWNTDLLEMLGILAQLGVHDERMRPAINHVVGLKNDKGRWNMGKSFNSRYLTPIEKDGRPSKLVTLHAMVLLKRLPPDLLP
jgi:hypothetical protein